MDASWFGIDRKAQRRQPSFKAALPECHGSHRVLAFSFNVPQPGYESL